MSFWDDLGKAIVTVAETASASNPERDKSHALLREAVAKHNAAFGTTLTVTDTQAPAGCPSGLYGWASWAAGPIGTYHRTCGHCGKHHMEREFKAWRASQQAAS